MEVGRRTHLQGYHTTARSRTRRRLSSHQDAADRDLPAVPVPMAPSPEDVDQWGRSQDFEGGAASPPSMPVLLSVGEGAQGAGGTSQLTPGSRGIFPFLGYTEARKLLVSVGLYGVSVSSPSRRTHSRVPSAPLSGKIRRGAQVQA